MCKNKPYNVLLLKTYAVQLRSFPYVFSCFWVMLGRNSPCANSNNTALSMVVTPLRVWYYGGCNGANAVALFIYENIFSYCLRWSIWGSWDINGTLSREKSRQLEMMTVPFSFKSLDVWRLTWYWYVSWVDHWCFIF